MRKNDDGFGIVIIYTAVSIFLVILVGIFLFWTDANSVSKYNNGFCKECSNGKYYIINDYIYGGYEYVNLKCDNCGYIVRSVLKNSLAEN
jgi:hypothetical protein